MGAYTWATGDYSTAMGRSTMALGAYSTALGYYVTVRRTVRLPLVITQQQP